MTKISMIEDVRRQLLALGEKEYGDFSAGLMPNVDRETVIGVRIPILRKMAKRIAKDAKEKEIESFLLDLPHKYYEENDLHAFVISEIKDVDLLVSELDRFLPYVDNWATCDSLRPKAIAKNKEEMTVHIIRWLSSAHTYTVRFGIEMLMVHYLDEAFEPEYPRLVAEIKSDEYYVKMMQAWYFATALALRWDSVIGYLDEKLLDPWGHNMTVRKATESLRITEEQKCYLKALKISLK